MDLPTAQERLEKFLAAAATGDISACPMPVTREEMYLYYIAENGGSGGGSGGTSNYNSLLNLPRIGGEIVQGNKSLHAYGIQSELTFDDAPTEGSTNPIYSKGVFSALAGKVDKESGKGLSSNDYTTAEKTKLDGIEAGAQKNIIGVIKVNGEEVAPIDGVVDFSVITEAVDNLINYYKKSEVYTQEEVDNLIGGLSSITLDVVDELPTTDISTSTIYLLPAGDDVYTQYIYSNGGWKVLGSTTVDLSNYYTKAQIAELLAQKQDLLTFDDEPKALSMNPVKSGGIYTALAGKQNKLTFDNVPTALSDNPVKSGGVYEALDNKQDRLEFDTEPTAGSLNPVTSDGVKSALENVNVGKATLQTLGVVKPDGETININDDGTISASASLTPDKGIVIEDNKISTEQYEFIGTKSEWDALSTTQKKQYTTALITDDEDGTGTSSGTGTITSKVVSGFVHWERCGCVVVVSPTILVSSGVATGDALVTGLPTPLASEQRFALSVLNTEGCRDVKLTKNGELTFGQSVSLTVDAYLAGSFTYIAKE